MPDSTTLIIGGLAGTGSTTAAQQVAERLGFEHVYGGGIFRQMADQAGQPLEAFMTELFHHPDREKAVDDRLLSRAERGEAVIESRVLPWLVPPGKYFTAWLTCDFDERVRRIRKREPFRDEADARKHITYRGRVDAKRYRSLYDVDLSDLSKIDLVIDTTNIPAGTAATRITEAYRLR